MVIVRDAWQSVGPWLETFEKVPVSLNIIVDLWNVWKPGDRGNVQSVAVRSQLLKTKAVYL